MKSTRQCVHTATKSGIEYIDKMSLIVHVILLHDKTNCTVIYSAPTRTA